MNEFKRLSGLVNKDSRFSASAHRLNAKGSCSGIQVKYGGSGYVSRQDVKQSLTNPVTGWANSLAAGFGADEGMAFCFSAGNSLVAGLNKKKCADGQECVTASHFYDCGSLSVCSSSVGCSSLRFFFSFLNVYRSSSRPDRT
jgi:hypothetical protein